MVTVKIHLTAHCAPVKWLLVLTEPQNLLRSVFAIFVMLDHPEWPQSRSLFLTSQSLLGVCECECTVFHHLSTLCFRCDELWQCWLPMPSHHCHIRRFLSLNAAGSCWAAEHYLCAFFLFITWHFYHWAGNFCQRTHQQSNDEDDASGDRDPH